MEDRKRKSLSEEKKRDWLSVILLLGLLGG